MRQLFDRVAVRPDFVPVLESATPPDCCREVDPESLGRMYDLVPFERGEAIRLLEVMSPILDRKKDNTAMGILKIYDRVFYIDPDLLSGGAGVIEMHDRANQRILGNARDSISAANEIHAAGQLCWRINIARTPNRRFMHIIVMKNSDDYFLVILNDGRRDRQYMCDQIDCACLLIRWMIQADSAGMPPTVHLEAFGGPSPPGGGVYSEMKKRMTTDEIS